MKLSFLMGVILGSFLIFKLEICIILSLLYILQEYLIISYVITTIIAFILIVGHIKAFVVSNILAVNMTLENSDLTKNNRNNIFKTPLYKGVFWRIKEEPKYIKDIINFKY